jgi:hypothetical protein
MSKKFKLTNETITNDAQKLCEQLEHQLSKIARYRGLTINVGCIRYTSDALGKVNSFRVEISAIVE